MLSPQTWAAGSLHAFTVHGSVQGHPRTVSDLLVCWAVLGCGGGVQVLRETLGCSLPVEVAWQGPKEMDNVTLAALQHRFGPLRGFDVQAMPYPPQMRRYEGGMGKGNGWGLPLSCVLPVGFGFPQSAI